jgi:hypothetical protein
MGRLLATGRTDTEAAGSRAGTAAAAAAAAHTASRAAARTLTSNKTWHHLTSLVGCGRGLDLVAREPRHGVANGQPLQVLPHLDAGGSKGVKGLGTDRAGEQTAHAGPGDKCRSLDTGPLSHRLGRTIINIVGFHGFQVHNDKTGGPAEARVNPIIQGRTLTRYRNFSHARHLIGGFAPEGANPLIINIGSL